MKTKIFVTLGQIALSCILVLAFIFLVLSFGKRPEVKYQTGELVYNQQTETHEVPLDAVISIVDTGGQPIPQQYWSNVLNSGWYRPTPVSSEKER